MYSIRPQCSWKHVDKEVIDNLFIKHNMQLQSTVYTCDVCNSDSHVPDGLVDAVCCNCDKSFDVCQSCRKNWVECPWECKVQRRPRAHSV